MALSAAMRNAMLTGGVALVTHLGLVNASGVEISGGDPAYARKAVTWDTAADGVISPTEDIAFDIPAETTVGGWAGFSAATAGTNHGGDVTVADEVFAAQGTYTLLKAATGYTCD